MGGSADAGKFLNGSSGSMLGSNPAGQTLTTPTPQAKPAQMAQVAQAAKASNQMAGVSDVKQSSVPNVGQISFGGS